MFINPVCSLLLILLLSAGGDNFKTVQLGNIRVAKAYKEKEDVINNILRDSRIERRSLEIFLRVFKKERIMELWGKDRDSVKFVLLDSYPVCAVSGGPGPKRKQGDFQVPEGFYQINMFNPESNFYLSLGIDYPNKSDRILTPYKKPGGSIFIHGDCVTIGCIPITDDRIKELYIFAVEARANGQRKIQVHIFPVTIGSRTGKFRRK
jgi:murein L,D-transpeptidase YafK